MPGSRQEEAKAQAVRVAIGDAIRRAYKGSPYPRQEDLAWALGVDQSTVSKWCRGEISVNVETIERIETVCGRLHGTIFWDAGLVEPEFIFTINADKLLEDALADRSNVVKLAPAARRDATDRARKATTSRSSRLRTAATRGKPAKKTGKRTVRPRPGDAPEEDRS